MNTTPTAILTPAYPLLYAAAVRIHGPSPRYVVQRCTPAGLTYHEKNFMPRVPDVEGADHQEMGNLRMNVGFFVKHSISPEQAA